MNETFFSLEDYRELMRYLSENYDIVPFNKWSMPGQVILRHDIDVDLYGAWQIAQIERDFGIRATYFILMSGAAYNPLSQNSRKLIREIEDMDHEIGLHFDLSVYDINEPINYLYEKEVIKRIDLERELLDSILRNKIQTVSFHNYSANPIPHSMLPIGLESAYDLRVFSDEIYWSDSRGVVKKDIESVLNKTKEGKTVQILMHPVYYPDEPMTYGRLFDRAIMNYIDSIDEEYRINKLYDEEVRKKEVLWRWIKCL